MEKLIFKVINRLLFLLKLHQIIIITFEHKEKVDQEYFTEAIIKRVNLENVEDALVYETSTKVNIFKDFLKKGDWGYYAYLKGEFVHRSWVTFGPQTIYRFQKHVPLHLQEKEAYIHYCETSKKARKKGVYTAVLCKIVKDLKNSRIRKIYISTNEDNLASHKGILKSGFQEKTRTKVTSFMGVTITRGVTVPSYF